MAATAMRRGYGISDAIRAGVIETAWEIIQDPASKKRERIAAMHLILEADKFDLKLQQADQAVEFALLALAESKEIKDEVLRIVQAGSSPADSSVDIEEQAEAYIPRQTKQGLD